MASKLEKTSFGLSSLAGAKTGMSEEREKSPEPYAGGGGDVPAPTVLPHVWTTVKLY